MPHGADDAADADDDSPTQRVSRRVGAVDILPSTEGRIASCTGPYFSPKYVFAVIHSSGIQLSFHYHSASLTDATKTVPRHTHTHTYINTCINLCIYIYIYIYKYVVTDNRTST